MLFESVLIFEYLLSCNIKMYSRGSRFLVKFALKKKKWQCNCGRTTGDAGFTALKAGPADLLPSFLQLRCEQREESRGLPFHY